MKPCAQPDCPALATRGDFCPVHAWRGTVADLLEGRRAGEPAALFLVPAGGPGPMQGSLTGEWPATPEETAKAIDQRERIARMYGHAKP